MRAPLRQTFLLSVTVITFLILTLIGPVNAQQATALQSDDAAAASTATHEAYLALQRKDYTAAVESSLKATALDPKRQYAWSYLAFAYEQLGEYPQAEEALHTLIALNPRFRGAYNSLGVVIARQGRIDEAIADYRKQMDLDPQNGYAARNLSVALASRNQWDEARKYATIAMATPPVDAHRWWFLGQTQIKSGHVDEARDSFARALALPHDAMIDNDVAYDLANAGYDLDRSWTLISGAIEETAQPVCEPRSLSDADKCTDQLRKASYLIDTAGWILYRQGKTDEVEPYLRTAFAITPHAESRLHMAVLFARTGRLDEAVHAFAQARSLQGFSHLDLSETRRELAKAAGGESELDALLTRIPTAAPSSVEPPRVIALVDRDGKVIEAQAVAPAPPSLAAKVRSMTFPVLAWPGYSLRSIRSVEFEPDGDDWKPALTYIGTTPPPPPCGPPPKPATHLLTQASPGATPSRGCPAL